MANSAPYLDFEKFNNGEVVIRNWIKKVAEYLLEEKMPPHLGGYNNPFKIPPLLLEEVSFSSSSSGKKIKLRIRSPYFDVLNELPLMLIGFSMLKQNVMNYIFNNNNGFSDGGLTIITYHPYYRQVDLTIIKKLIAVYG
jgi:hypothetical protein